MRLIDADAMLDYLDDDPPYNWTDSDAEIQAVADWEQFKSMINAQPTIINVEDVVYTKWAHYPDCGVTYCPICGWSIEECWDSKRCPECGAYMRNGG